MQQLQKYASPCQQVLMKTVLLFLLAPWCLLRGSVFLLQYERFLHVVFISDASVFVVVFQLFDQIY